MIININLGKEVWKLDEDVPSTKQIGGYALWAEPYCWLRQRSNKTIQSQ